MANSSPASCLWGVMLALSASATATPTPPPDRGYNERGVATRWEPLSESRWDDGRPFFEGLAAVNRKEKWGFIDKKGSFVLRPQWDAAVFFSGEFASVEVNEKWGVIDRSGKIIAKPQWNWAYPYRGDFCFVSGPGGAGYLDKSGNMVITGPWSKGSNVTNGLAVVKEQETGKSLYIRIWNEIK